MHPTAQYKYTILPSQMADTYNSEFIFNIKYRKYSLSNYRLKGVVLVLETTVLKAHAQTSPSPPYTNTQLHIQ